MKPAKTPNGSQHPAKPLDPQQFPAQAQTEATASREQVRDAAPHVQAPRESKRPQERSSKRPAGG